MAEKKAKKIVVLATGGTIAGVAPDVSRPQQYQAGVLPVEALLGHLDSAGNLQVVSEQVAQIDSKNMSHQLWADLAERCSHWLSQDDVQGLVITHGTDTIEETAYFLHRVLRADKPVAMTCAMLPANAPNADGPGNLRDALSWVAQVQSPGVVVVCAGQAHAAPQVQKIHTDRCDAFSSGPAGPLARTDNHHVWHVNPVPTHASSPWLVPHVHQLPAVEAWPRVSLVISHAGVDGQLVRAAMQCEPAPQGWVVAATGQGTVHHDLLEALTEAQSQGAKVVRASRCAWGHVAASTPEVNDAGLKGAGDLSPVKARIALMLQLMAENPLTLK